MNFKNFLQGPFTTFCGVVITLGTIAAFIFMPAIQGWHAALGCLVGLLLWFAPDPPAISVTIQGIIEAIKKKFL